jgi:hypothetical protein
MYRRAGLRRPFAVPSVNTPHAPATGPAGAVAGAAQRWPHRTALVSVETAHRGGLTWMETAGRCDEIACGLLAAGARLGDALALRCRTRPEALLVATAALGLGLRVGDDPAARFVVTDDATGLGALPAGAEGIALAGTVPDPHCSLEVLAARGIAFAASRRDELDGARAAVRELPDAVARLGRQRGGIGIAAPASGPGASAAVSAVAATGSAVGLAPSAVRACERFGPATIVTTSAGAEELSAILAGGSRWRPRWRRRLALLVVEDDAPPAAVQALVRAGLRVEASRTW